MCNFDLKCAKTPLKCAKTTPNCTETTLNCAETPKNSVKTPTKGKGNIKGNIKTKNISFFPVFARRISPLFQGIKKHFDLFGKRRTCFPRNMYMFFRIIAFLCFESGTGK